MGRLLLTAADLRAAAQDPDLRGDPIPLLIDALVSPEADLRREAVSLLRDLPDGRAVEPLCRLLTADPCDHIRFRAAEVLGVIASPAAIPSLLAAITDPEAGVRLRVAEALGRIGTGDPRVAPALCCLLIDADTGVREIVLEALGDLGDEVALPAVRTRLEGERGIPEVRVWVHYALARLGAEPFPFPEVAAVLRRSRRAVTRISTSRVLVRIASPATLPRIRRALQAARDRETGEGMREAMRGFLQALDSLDAERGGEDMARP